MKNLKLNDRDYSNSGVKTLRFFSRVFLVLGCLSFLCFIPEWIVTIDYRDEFNVIGVACSIGSLLSGLLSFGICLALATIAEGSLLNTAYINHMIKKESEKEALLNNSEENKEE